ncbi:zinc finger protein 1035 [Tachysurus vachellii]|uniref:zinc finger protein 1035 n=1 Tax=Tachysurus vachellii TaxID=175792 RepID=UPI00296AFDDD|nr:zinc finger protein 1035 [Tachysurus vachellii]XP_060726842.1 zinc finger protein 1035 [Tachysurus vachellii]XP_060726843.1 zinc finger protein 1035 [Tachysurus vachellii]
MDHFIEDDLSSVMDSVIPSSELNCMNSVANSVQDTNHETSHDGENHIMPEQITFSKTEPLVFDKPLYGSALDPALLTVSNLEDYSDISSCSEADFGHLLNALEKNPDQSSELPDAGNSRDKNELEIEAASDHATEKQELPRASETEVEGRCGSIDNVIDGDDREERNLLNLEFQCSDLKTTEGENGCPLKTEEQTKSGFLFQTSNCGVTESSEISKDTTQISSVCALDINGAHQSTEDGKENTNSNENIGVQNDCHLKGNTTCEAKNNTPEYKFKHDVKNTAHDNEPEYNRTKNSEEVEHSSFEFLQSCFGLTSLDNTKSDPNAANVLLSESMTQDSQNCEVNHSTLGSVTGAQIKEASDNGLLEPTIQRTCSSTSVSQDPGQQSEPLEDQFIKGLARTESTHDTRIINSASLLSSKKFMRKLQPVVLVKTTKHNAKDGNMYICSVCQKNWQNLDELIEHHHDEHFEHAFQYCLTCGAYISTGTLAEHLCKQKDMQLSTVLSSTKQLTEKLNAKYLCKYCEKPFIKVSYHKDHEQRHRTVTPHRCNCCGLYFSNAKKLLAHKQKVKCSPMILEPNEQRKVSEKVPKDQTKPAFTIHDCFVKLVDINKDRPSPQKIDCSICGKSFKLRAQLKVHLRSHTGANPFKCTKCKKVFKYSWNLDKHKELCSGNATKQRITNPPIRGSFLSGFACPICPRIFRYSYNRTRHMRQQCLKEYMRKGKGKVGNRYECPMCDETFSMSCNRNRHIKKKCFEQYKLLRLTCKKKLVKENIKEEKEEKQVLPTENLSSFKCKVCSASFAHKSGVYRHMKKHSLLQRSTAQVGKHDSPTNVKEPDSNKEAPQNQECSSPNSSDMVTSPPIVCSFCDKSFISSESLKNHLQLHVGKKPFRCLECGKSFIRRGHLITHKNIHKRRIQCSVCKKIVPTIADLLKHRQSHITKGMLQCPDCPKQFKFPVYLLRHVATHAKKERMLNSPTKKSADEHVKEIRSNKEPFNCGICQKAFVDSEAISEHCLSHLPKPSVSKCPVCKHNFTSRATLIRHFRLHTGERPFPCKICGKHFQRKEPLAFHEVKCKGPKEKPISTLTTAQTQQKCEVTAVSKSGKVPKQFRCSYCPHIFGRSSHLKMHENAHLANNLVSCFKCGKYYKKNKIYGHRKRCTAKESSPGEAFKSEQSGNAHESKCKSTNLVVTNRTCRIPKDIGMKKDHLKERCPHCSKRFQYRSVLLRHLHSHLGKQQFACNHCNQKYSNKSSCQQHEALCDGVLRQHEAKSLNESEETKHIPGLQSASSLKECTVIIGENGEELKCNFCTKTFTKPRNLRRHILTHTEVKPYRCKTCENCFSRYDHLKYHQNRCRGKKQQLDVNLEQKAHHAGSQAKKHTQSDVFECSSCSKTFSSHTNLTRHFSMLHSTFKPFSCKRCGSGFTSQDNLKRHSVRVNCSMSSAECLEQGKMPTALNTQVQSCRETSKLMQRIEGHFSNKWKFPCEYCPRRFKTQTQLKMHTRLHTGEKPFGCASCDERFIRRDYLKRHLTKCSGKRQGPKVLCDKCGGLFTQEALEQHQNNCIISLKSTDCPVNVSSISSHSKVKAFSCVSCNEHFLLFSQLQQHILTKHISDGLQPSGIPEYETLSSNLPIKEEPVDDDCAETLQDSFQIYAKSGSENTDCAREKPFECEQCNMRFINSGGLGMHMRIHTTKYPLSCKKCNKGFWSKKVQEKHMRKCKGLKDSRNECSTNDAVSTELECTPNDEVLVFNEGSNTTGTGVLQTKFSCKDQDKGNADKEDTVVHKYQCSECEQSFTDGLMLISHLEAHGREDQERRLGKSNRCHICGKTFDHAGMLQRHVKTQHQETVKNTCPVCFRSFRYPSDLDIHRSCHDPNRPFVCETCDLRFWTSKSLSTHQRLTHSASEPLKTVKPIMKPEGLSPKLFTCYPCNKVYTIRRSYMKHCRAKHKGRSESLGDVKNATTEPQLNNNESDGSDADDKDVSDDDSDSAPYFPCHVCGKTFLTSEGLEDHQRCHLGEKPYECEECGKCFIQLVNLQQHQRSHKSEFQCQMCGKGFVSLFALRKHKHTHVRKHPHRCTKCNLSFTRSSQLTEHMITHRDENFPCDLCHKNFSCKSSRAEHRKIHTEADEELPPLIPPAKQISPPVSISPSLSTVQQYKYCCEICHVRFPDPEQLSEHGCSPAKERPYSCKDCNKHFLHGSHLKKHQLTHQLSGTRSFQCNSCHMSFSHRHHFLTHLQIHGGEEPSKSQTDKVKTLNTDDSNQNKIYRCPICPESFSQVLELANHLSVHANMCNVCNKTFSTKQQLEKHEQSHLSAATQYECTECGKSFLGSDAFRQHYCVHQKHLSCSSLSTTDRKRSVENSFDVLPNNEEEEEVDVGEDFYNCPTCNKRFPSNTALKEHQKLHEFDRPFKCLVCGKSFTKKKYLTQHQQKHNEQPYQCDLCTSSFKTEQSLLSHRKTHDADRRYRCSICDKSYRTPYDLSRHEQKHPELQKFTKVSGDHRCDMCYKSFGLLSQLRQHQETHVGQVVYECTECDKAFAFLHLLEEHQKTHGTSTDTFQSQSPSAILFQSPVIE